MNPQYLQQQRPNYGPPSSSATYGELNANYPPKGPHDPLSLPLQKPLVGPPSTTNVSSMSRPPYYANDAQAQATDTRQAPLLQQSNPSNLVDQMSNMALSGHQRLTSSENYPLKSEKNVPPPLNGLSNQNLYPSPGEQIPNLPAEKSDHLPQKLLPNQGFLSSSSSNISSAYGSQSGPLPGASIGLPSGPQVPPLNGRASGPPSRPPSGPLNGPLSKSPSRPSREPSQGLPIESSFPGQQQPPGQIPSFGSLSGSNIPKSTPQPTSLLPVDLQNQQLSQNKHSASPVKQADLNTASPHSGKSSGIPLTSPSIGNQQSFGAPSLLSNQLQGSSLSQSPIAPPPLTNQQSMSGPPLSGPPLSTSHTSRPNQTGPGLHGQNVQSPVSMSQQSFSRPPLSSQSGLSGPSPSGQHLSSSYGQQNFSGLTSPPGQQSLHSPYSNQTSEQRRFSPSQSLSGQTNYNNTYSNQLNHQHGDSCYSHGCQQQYSQNSPYSNQTNSYQSGVTSPTGNYQSNAQAQARRLDPDQMPSPIQVIQDDQRVKGGVFTTNQKGLVPPLVTTKFIVEDQGNASPRFIRSSIYTVPTAADILKQTQVPFSLILNPMAQVEEGEYEPPIVDMGEIGPVRCNRCKAYMNPFMQFVDAGRRFQCMFCRATTEVPTEYFQHLDHTGQRMDRYERPELMLGTYEFVATKDYCRDNKFPNPPAIIFVIDVSYNTIKSGLVNLLCRHMKKIIRNLPVDVGQSKSHMKVGFITYSSTVHFYNLQSTLAQPQMMIVGDVQDVFMPLLNGFLCDPEESEALIDNLMIQIPTMFGNTRETETILAPAIQAGLEALKASECTGKLLVFHSSLPIAEAPGKLKNRDDRKVLGTEKEKSVIAPQTNFYNNLGQDCVGSGCSVDLFVFNNSYVDIATIGQVCRLTGGEVYKYTYFQADTDGERLITDIINNISRPIAFDAVMRVRTSTGVRPVDFYGHFYMSNTTDIELASLDSDKAIAVEIKHDDKLSEDEGVYIQAALLYTSCSGFRRLRIINLSLKTSSQMAELYKSCDLDAIINYLSKQSVFKLVESSPKAVKESLNARCANILASYRKHCASPSSAGQLILPECMKLLPLYINGLLKSDAISGGNGITCDQKSYVMITVATMPICESLAHVYPRLLPLHEVDHQDTDLPQMLRCSIDKISDEGAYLLENGIHMFLWLGSNLSPQWVQSVFGVTSVSQVDTDRTAIPPSDNPLNKRIREIITYVQSERRYCMRLTITRQRDKMEVVMRQFLIEDRGSDGSPGYVDFLCHMHREIRTLLS